jgi:hypothetical protein
MIILLQKYYTIFDNFYIIHIFRRIEERIEEEYFALIQRISPETSFI